MEHLAKACGKTPGDFLREKVSKELKVWRIQHSYCLLLQGVGNGAASTEVLSTWLHLTDMDGHRVPVHILHVDQYAQPNTWGTSLCVYTCHIF